MRNLLILLVFLAALPSCTPSATGPSVPSQVQATSVSASPRPPHPTLEEAVAPKAAGVPVRGVKWSADGRYLGFVAPESDRPDAPMALWVYDTRQGSRKILVRASDLVSSIRESEEEKARRERMRMSRTGIVEYSWGPSGRTILFPLSGAVYAYDMATGRAHRLQGTEDAEPEITPTLSKTGLVAYAKGGGVTIQRLDGTVVRQIFAKPLRLGVAEFVAQEEMGRYRGLWWSPDGRWLLYTGVDERDVPVRERLDYGPSGAKVVTQRYPSVGKPNARVHLFVAEARKGGTTFQLQLGKYEYVARAGWLPDGRAWAALQDRLQKELRLVACDVATKKCNDFNKITSNTWVELHDDFSFGKDSYIWAIEEPSGRTLALFGYDGTRRLTLVSHEPLASLLRVDWKAGLAWYSVYLDGGIRTGLRVWDFRHNRVRSVTLPAGWHSFSMSPAGDLLVDFHSTVSLPTRMYVRRTDGTKIAEIPPLVRPARWVFSLVKPQFVQIPYQGGMLNGLWFSAPHRTRRTIVFVYGGPHGHMVRDVMRGSVLWHHWFARKGFNVLVVDGRGGLYKDLAFAKAPYHAFGRYEVEDSRAIAAYLDTRGIPRECRGIWGWSYGGYTVLATMTDADLFAAGAAVAPPTEWRLYDTHYTERYMGLDPKLYDAAAITKDRLARMKGALLLVHGMSDDNVLFINSLRIIYALQQIPRTFELMVYPGKAHSLWGNSTRRHLLMTLLDFFEDSLCR